MKTFLFNLSLSAILISCIFMSSMLVYADEHYAINSLTDIDESHQYWLSMAYLAEEEVLQGYEDNTARPGQKVNRAEMMTLIVRALDLEDETKGYTGCFEDAAGEWYEEAVCYGQEQGWIDGYPSGDFIGWNPVLKVEATKMIVNAMGFAEEVEDSVDETLYYDVDNSEWYAKYLQVAENHNFFELGGYFDPGTSMTRGLVGETLFRSIAANSSESGDYTREARDSAIEAQDLSGLLPDKTLLIATEYSVEGEVVLISEYEEDEDDVFSVEAYAEGTYLFVGTAYSGDPENDETLEVTEFHLEEDGTVTALEVGSTDYDYIVIWLAEDSSYGRGSGSEDSFNLSDETIADIEFEAIDPYTDIRSEEESSNANEHSVSGENSSIDLSDLSVDSCFFLLEEAEVRIYTDSERSGYTCNISYYTGEWVDLMRRSESESEEWINPDSNALHISSLYEESYESYHKVSYSFSFFRVELINEFGEVSQHALILDALSGNGENWSNSTRSQTHERWMDTSPEGSSGVSYTQVNDGYSIDESYELATTSESIESAYRSIGDAFYDETGLRMFLYIDFESDDFPGEDMYFTAPQSYTRTSESWDQRYPEDYSLETETEQGSVSFNKNAFIDWQEAFIDVLSGGDSSCDIESITSDNIDDCNGDDLTYYYISEAS